MEEITLLHMRHSVFSIDLALLVNIQNTVNHVHFDSRHLSDPQLLLTAKVLTNKLFPSRFSNT